MIVDYTCMECGANHTSIPMINSMVKCPICFTQNDIWMEGEPEPERHKIKNQLIQNDEMVRNSYYNPL